MTPFQQAVIQKRDILRQQYGGSMTLQEFKSELGTRRETAKAVGEKYGLAFQATAKRVRYDTDLVAQFLVSRRL